MTFGEKLLFLRRQSGLSQEQIAEKLNVSRQAVSRWEAGAIPDMENKDRAKVKLETKDRRMQA